MLSIKAFAKINLTLYLTGILENGYHSIHSYMQTVSLCDEITLKKARGISLSFEGKTIPVDDTNTAVKAAKLMMEEFSLPGVEIFIKKNIPVCAGLGGPSADAAAVINGMEKLFLLDIDFEKKSLLAKKIGADVPFLLRGGLALCEGIGEKLTPVEGGLFANILIAKPKEKVSTVWAYKEFDKQGRFSNPPGKDILSAIKNKDLKEIARWLYNDFEAPVFKEYPLIGTLKKDMIKEGALGSLMSGSGSSVFGIFQDEKSLLAAQNRLMDKYEMVEFYPTVSVS